MRHLIVGVGLSSFLLACGATPIGGDGGETGGAGGVSASGGQAGMAPGCGGSAGSTEPPPGDCSACSPTTLYSSDGVIYALGEEHPLLYFVEGLPDETDPDTLRAGPLMQVPGLGGDVSSLTLAWFDNVTHGNSIVGVVADDSLVYVGWGGSGGIARVPVFGAEQIPVLDGAPTALKALRTNETHVFTFSGKINQHLYRIPKSGGVANDLAYAWNMQFVDFEVDENFVYLLRPSTVLSIPVDANDQGASALVRGAAAEGEIFTDLAVLDENTLLVASNQRIAALDIASEHLETLSAGAGYALTTDGSTAYFFRPPEGSADCGAGSQLLALSLSDLSLRHLATTSDNCPVAAEQDADGVYWLSADRSSILAAYK